MEQMSHLYNNNVLNHFTLLVKSENSSSQHRCPAYKLDPAKLKDMLKSGRAIIASVGYVNVHM